MPTPTFFPGHISIFNNSTITVTPEQAKEIKASINADLTLIKNFDFKVWRSTIAARYAADPIVSFLLESLETSKTNEQKPTTTWSHVFP